MIKSNLKRIYKNKIKVLFVVLVLLIPVFDALSIIKPIVENELPKSQILNPHYATFLSAQANMDFFYHRILMWFLPLYFMVILGDRGIDDYKTKSRNLYVCRMGKKQYILKNLIFSFCFAFILFTVSMLINYILVSIICNGGEFLMIDPTDSPQNILYTWSCKHPGIANVLFIALTAYFAGLISTVGTMLSYVIHDKKIVYVLTFLLWFFYDLFTDTSIMYMFQPFTEYGFETMIPLVIGTTIIYLMIIVAGGVWEMKHETI